MRDHASLREIELFLPTTRHCRLHLHQLLTTPRKRWGAIHVLNDPHKQLQHLETKLLHMSAHPPSRNRYLKRSETIIPATLRTCSISTIVPLFPNKKSAHFQIRLAAIRVQLMLLRKLAKTLSSTYVKQTGYDDQINIPRTIRYGSHGK